MSSFKRFPQVSFSPTRPNPIDSPPFVPSPTVLPSSLYPYTKAKIFTKSKDSPRSSKNKTPYYKQSTSHSFSPFLSLSSSGKMLNSIASGSILLLLILRFHLPFYACVNAHIYATFSSPIFFILFFTLVWLLRKENVKKKRFEYVFIVLVIFFWYVC